MWYIVDIVVLVNILNVFVFGRYWCLNDEDRGRICVVFSNICRSNEGDWIGEN